MAHMKRTASGLFVVLAVLAACAAPAGTPNESAGPSPGDSGAPSASPPPTDGGETGGIEHPAGADEAILVMEEAGGFMMVGGAATQLPSFALLGDGRVIMQGAQTLEFPGPILPALIERTLTEDGIQQVLDAVEETNLFTGDLELNGAQNVVADASNTVFTLHANGTDVTVSVYALGFLDPSMGNLEGVSAAEIEAHATLSQLRDALQTIDTSVTADGWEGEGWQPYEPAAFRLFIRDVTGEPVDEELPGQLRDWPTGDDPAAFGADAGFNDGTTCGVVDGDAGAAWFAELSQSNQNTLWTTDGDDRWSVRPRPLLPHEEATCPPVDT